jgi:hypothetical protein
LRDQVVELLGSTGYVSEALRELGHMAAGGITGDYRIYQSLIRNAIEHGRIDVASEVQGLIAERAIVAPPGARRILLSTLLKRGKFHGALAFMDLTPSEGDPVEEVGPDRLMCVLDIRRPTGAP